MNNGKDVVYFFLREYNDIDHITPLIDHICSRRRTIVKIFAVNNNKKVFSQNNNLLYIERSYGIKTIDLLSLCSKDKRYRVTEKCINRIQLLIGNNGIPILKDIIRVIGIKVIGVLHLSTQSIFRKFLFSQNTPNVCLFDIGTEYAYPYRLIHKIISKSNIPRICIHHGLITHLNRDFNINTKDSKCFSNTANKTVDFPIIPAGKTWELGNPGGLTSLTDKERYDFVRSNTTNNKSRCGWIKDCGINTGVDAVWQGVNKICNSVDPSQTSI